MTIPNVDSAIIVKRAGTSDDPYTSVTESLVIVNGRVVLKEIPDKYSGIEIEGFVETDSSVVESGKFRVDYAQGIIYFNISDDGALVNIGYYGKGYILYPSSRVYVSQEGSPDVVRTLQEVIDAGKTAIGNLDLIQSKIDEVDEAIANTDVAIDNTNAAIGNVNEAINNANTAASSVNDAIALADNAATNANNAATAANEARDAANTAATNANTAATNATNATSDLNETLSRFVHMGEWSNLSSYSVNNIVTRDGSSYMCIQGHQGQRLDKFGVPTGTTFPPKDSPDYWKLLGSKGSTGATGATGPSGVVWKGNYNPLTQYIIGDAVLLNGSSYVVHSTPPVGTSPTNTVFWTVVALKGADGNGSGTVTSVSSANGDIAVANNATTPVITLNSGTGANQIVKRDPTGKIADLAGYAALAGATFTGNVQINGAFTFKVNGNDVWHSGSFDPSTKVSTSVLGQASGVATLGSDSKVPFAQIPTGTGASQVAVGNHTHTAASVGAIASTEKGQASGVATLDGSTKVPFAQLPTGTGASQVATGNHTHTAASVGAIPSTEKGQASGVATLGSDTKIPVTQLPTGSGNGIDADMVDGLHVRINSGILQTSSDGTTWTGVNSLQVNGVYIRNNSGVIEWSSDNATWNALGGGGGGGLTQAQVDKRIFMLGGA